MKPGETVRGFDDVPSLTEPTAPLSLAAYQESLILRHAHLSEGLPGAVKAAEEATAALRAIRKELDEITRVLKATERVRTPRRRKA